MFHYIHCAQAEVLNFLLFNPMFHEIDDAQSVEFLVTFYSVSFRVLMRLSKIVVRLHKATGKGSSYYFKYCDEI